MNAQRGFSVPELLIAMTLFLALGIATLGVLHGLTRVLDGRSTAQNGVVTLEQQIARLRSDAATSFAVFVPTRDVFGGANRADPQTVPAHEVAFYTKTDSGVETWWAYHYDAATHALQRYDFDPTTHAVGVFDRNAAATIDTRARYAPLTGVKSFAVRSVQANELTDARIDPFAGVLAGLMGRRTPTGDPVGFVPASGVSRADLYGGNASVEIVLVTERGRRTVHLVSGAMASGFTIHEAVAMRSYVYRKNTHGHSWFGLAYKSRAHIYTQLQYNLHPSDPTSPWRIGCDYEIHGQGQGMDFSDPTIDYNPSDIKQTTAFNFFTVTHDGYEGQAPIQCDPKIPTPNDTAPPTLVAPPIAIDTPPPCFHSADPCWPYNAPPNWSPPSPWPASSPPPDWCAGHQASPLCGGDGGGPTGAPSVGGDTPPPAQSSPGPPVRRTPDPTQDPTEPPVRGPGHGRP